jgi:hypothetical protein
VPVLIGLRSWLAKNVKKSSPALARWLAACREQLETLTAQQPQPPADWRRGAAVSCNCADCKELKEFLADPGEKTHRFRVAQNRRQHLQGIIRQDHLDLDSRTDEHGRPYSLVCTKNTASYQASLAQYHQDQEHLATLRAIQANLAK